MGMLLLIVVLAIVVSAFAYGMMLYVPPPVMRSGAINVLSSKPEAVSPIDRSVSPEKAPEQAQNQKPENKTEASENQKPEAELSENRKLAIVKAVKRCLDAGIEEAQIAALLQSYKIKGEVQEEAARACMVKQVPSSVVAVLVGGDKQTTLRWVNSVTEKPAAVKEEA